MAYICLTIGNNSLFILQENAYLDLKLRRCRVSCVLLEFPLIFSFTLLSEALSYGFIFLYLFLLSLAPLYFNPPPFFFSQALESCCSPPPSSDSDLCSCSTTRLTPTQLSLLGCSRRPTQGGGGDESAFVSCSPLIENAYHKLPPSSVPLPSLSHPHLSWITFTFLP